MSVFQMFRYPFIPSKIRSIFTALFMLGFMLSGHNHAHAHDIRPAVMDIGFSQNGSDYLDVRLGFTAESYLAGMDVSGLSDTDNSPVADEYNRLRMLPPEQLGALVEQAFPQLAQDIVIALDQQIFAPGSWELQDIIVEDVTNPELIRETQIRFRVPLPTPAPESSPASSPDGQAMVNINWPMAMGGLLIRQHGDNSNASYVEFLPMGGQSRGFALGEIYQLSLFDIVQRYIHSGIIHIVPHGLDHILFVIGLLAFSRSGHHLLLQISLFTVAHTLTLAGASLGLITLSPALVEPLIALSIAYIGVENLLRSSPQITPQFTLMRGGVVFAFGLLHGLGFASVLADFGLPDTAFLASLISFNIGVELGQLIVVIPLFVLFRYILAEPKYYKIIFQVPVSVLIALTGIYWALERVGMI
jgi:hydrogenase/urease accessory protein HupE